MRIEVLNPPQAVITAMRRDGCTANLQPLHDTGEVEILDSDETLAAVVERADQALSESDRYQPDIALEDKARIQFAREQVSLLHPAARREILSGVKPVPRKGEDSLALRELGVSVDNRRLRDDIYAFMEKFGYREERKPDSKDIKGQRPMEQHVSEVLYAQHGLLGSVIWFDTRWYVISPFRGGLWAAEGEGYLLTYREIERPESLGGRVYPSAAFVLWCVLNRVREDVIERGGTSEFPPMSAFVNEDGSMKEAKQ